MIRRVARATAQGILIFWLSFTLLFFLLRGLSDPAQLLLGQRSDKASAEAIRAQLHLDKPLWHQYLYALADLLPYREGHWQWPTLGFSYQYNRPVLALYWERLPATVLLAVSAAVLAITLGLAVGLKQATTPSWGMRIIVLFFFSMPGYVSGLLLLWLLGLELGRWTGLPLGGYVWQYDPTTDTMQAMPSALLLPALALALRPAAYFSQLVEAQAREILQADFIRAARARGKAFRAILLQDVLRNLLPSLATSFSQWFAGLFLGSLFVEALYEWPGVGKLLFFAFSTSDYPLLTGVAVQSVLVFVILNFLSELLSSWADPRLR